MESIEIGDQIWEAWDQGGERNEREGNLSWTVEWIRLSHEIELAATKQNRD